MKKTAPQKFLRRLEDLQRRREAIAECILAADSRTHRAHLREVQDAINAAQPGRSA